MAGCLRPKFSVVLPSLFHSHIHSPWQLVIYETSASELDIIRDISWTFPLHVFFQQRHGASQRSLYNVWKAYSMYDRDVGYVQWMSFLAGLLLLYMSEEDAFWLLVALLKGVVHAPMEGFYLTIVAAIVIGVILHAGNHLACDFPRLINETDKEYDHYLIDDFGHHKPEYIDFVRMITI